MQRERIWLSPPHMGGEELKYVQEAFDSNWISPMGPHLNEFENVLAKYVGVEHCAALSSGTAAIHLALIIFDVKREDEVICQSFTFSGSCNPIAYLGAKPVFVDSEEETWNMDPDLLKTCIEDRISKTGKKPKAIIVVHLYGMPAKMNEIMAISKQYEIPVIEDAAEALGSEYFSKKAGSIGDVGVFSFNGNKIITTSGGGALLSNNEEWIKKARYLATQARELLPHYEHKEIGYNYRLSNVCAAIGLGQMNVLQDRVSKKREIFSYYHSRLGEVHGLTFLKEPKGFLSNRWLTTILIQNDRITRETIRLALETENIESRPLWKPMHLQPVFAGCAFYGSWVSEKLFGQGLCLPSGTKAYLAEKDLIINRILNIFK